MPNLDVAGAYYHADFSETATGTALTTCASNNTSSGNCHGSVDAVSALIDWQFAPKWDTYIGTLYSKFHGGQASGVFLTTPNGTVDNWATTAGLRFRW
jgi:predicted porin